MAHDDFIRRAYEAWNQGDSDLIWDLLDPDIVIDATARVLNPEVYHGHEGFRQMTDEMSEAWDRWRMEPDEFIDCGDRTVVASRARARGRGSGIELDQTVYNVWKLRDGKVVRLAFYVDRDEALLDETKEQAGAESSTHRT